MVAILKQLFSLILPFTVLVIVPLLIEDNCTVTFNALFFIGLFFAVAGIVILIFTISLFIRIGRGTLAPWSPAKKLVTDGVYAYVRNPMITGVFITLIGESLIVQSINIFIWALVFFVINSIYFIISEEPGLEKRFGEEYIEYKRHVPRWIPRINPWISSSKDQQDSNQQ